MFNRMNLGTKIAAGFGFIVFLSAILGYVGWRGINQVRSFMQEYALWGEIDGVMNEGITQNALKLVNDLNVYRSTPTDENLKKLMDTLRDADKETAEWHALVKDYPKLETVAVDTRSHLGNARTAIQGFAQSLNVTTKIQLRWDNLIKTMMAYLDTTMEEVIDPAKEVAEQSQNIEKIVKWGEIDMVMNEAVIANVLRLQTASHDYASRNDDKHWLILQKAHNTVSQGLEEWKVVLGGQERMEQAARKISENLKTYAMLKEAYHQEVLKMQQLEQDTIQVMDVLFASLNDAMETVIDPAKAVQVKATAAAQKKASILAIVFGTVCVLLGSLLAFVITRSITKPINRVIEGLNVGAEQVAAATGQVSSASQSLAEGSSEQAASIEETSSSLEEMSSMTKQNADNANQADKLMKEANQVVKKANDSMTELTHSMEEISKASEETSKIIKTIDEIAFQTNLLALNAAVEAARAGEAGAGFAVVADEVRNLAMRAADAARNTAELIEGTVKKVKDGGELVGTTNEAFTEVAESAAKVGELVGEIAAASNEQAEGIEQVNKAVVEMDKVVQQNAANAEESASASEEMNAQAEQMKGFVYDLVTLVDGSTAEQATEGAVVTTGTQSVVGNRPVPTFDKKEIAHRVRDVKPEQVLPMDDDFKDF